MRGCLNDTVSDDIPLFRGIPELHGISDLPDVEPAERTAYEAIGPHFQGNPYGLSDDILEPHGAKVIEVPRTFEDIRDYLEHHHIEGIVFWKDGEPRCKIKRTDFGFSWPA